MWSSFGVFTAGACCLARVAMGARGQTCQASRMSLRASLMCALCILPPVAVFVACHSADPSASGSGTTGADKWCQPAVQPGPTGTPVRHSPSPCTVPSSAPAPFGTSSVSGGCNQCTPRCDAEKVPFVGGGAFYTLYDLPSGACETEGEICDMGAVPVQTCNGAMRGCAINGYRCSCTSGQWSCLMISAGGGICEPCAGSTDAGTD